MEIEELLGNNKFDMSPSPALSLLVVTGDDYFLSFEYDVIGPKARRFLRNFLVEQGFSSKGSREFSHSSYNYNLRIPKPQGVLGASPIDLVVTELNKNDGHLILVTPTECVMTILELSEAQNIEINEKQWGDFVYRHPVNFAKIKKWCRHLPSYTAFAELIPDLKVKQKEGIEKRKVKKALSS
jgi:hypothetical protein